MITVGKLREMLAPYQDNNKISLDVYEKEMGEIEATLTVYIPGAEKILLRDGFRPGGAW